MPPLELLQQGNGRDGIDAVVETPHGLKALEIDGSVDVEASPPGVGADRTRRAALDPALGNDGIVLRLNRVDETDAIRIALGSFEFFVRGEKGFLGEHPGWC